MEPQILIIEDDSFMQRLFERLLGLYNYKTTVIKGEEDILGRLANVREKPSLILLDLMMPKVSGLDVLKYLKEHDEWKSVPVVVVTNMEGEENTKKAIDMGAHMYIVKSEHEPREIIEKIKPLLPSGDKH
jgi:DNA-binding response OmpR family regulator